jgi:hypothetical protein
MVWSTGSVNIATPIQQLVVVTGRAWGCPLGLWFARSIGGDDGFSVMGA